MASPLPSFLLGAIIACLFIIQTHSTSRVAFDHYHKNNKPNYTVKLQHVDSGKNLTKFELIQRGIHRSNQRLKKIKARLNGDLNTETPVTAGNGEFLMDLAIGTPTETFDAIMDTGSDLIWTQCQPCRQCFSQPSPIYNPQSSSSFSQLSCTSQICQALPSHTCSNACLYSYSYGDSSQTNGYMGSETFTFESNSARNIGFGCGQENSGFGGAGNLEGLVGMGRGPLSLPSQLGVSQFSYCLTSIGSSLKSTLQMGSLASSQGSTMITPLIKNPSIDTFYYLKLIDVSVGGNSVGIPQGTFDLANDGSGGLIIDSGTTLTILVKSAYDKVKQAFISQINLPVYTGSSAGIDCCFQLPTDTSSVKVPSLVMHFDGANLELPTQNYFVEVSQGVACLAMAASSDMSIYGNIMQQNYEVLYDTENNQVSFTATQCGS